MRAHFFIRHPISNQLGGFTFARFSVETSGSADLLYAWPPGSH
jgi:hypothetical protein